MGDFGIGIDLDGSSKTPGKGFVARMGRIERKSRDVTPALQKIRKQFYAMERQRFASNGQGTWAPDTALILARKAKRGQDERVMRATGELYRALTTGRGEGAVDKLSPDELVMGARLKQAVVAQRTTGRRRRRVVVITKRRRNAWVRTIRDHILGEGE